jgi:aminomuconate-semialdehyde/2-hydroxymuconate-6-semialdehyde dehydrogenase
LGAVVSEDHMQKILKHIEDAPKQGGKILSGGNRVFPEGLEEGFYIEPTVIEVETNQCAINQEEVFGPVVTLMPFKNDDEALKMANESPYGLSATVWTQDINRCMRMGHELESGIIWINTWLNRDLRTPFGGMKNSGVGREGGMEALRFFTEPKNVCIEWK